MMRAARLITLLLGHVLRILPRASRFAIAMFAARLAQPIVALYLRRHPRHAPVTSGAGPDETLRLVLRSLVRSGTTFDPFTVCEDPDGFIETARQRGVLLVSGHFPINPLITRHVFDSGLTPLIINGRRFEENIWGTNVLTPSLLLSPQIMLQVRSELAKHHPVMMSIDRKQPDARSIPVETPYGTRYIMTPIFDFARRRQIPIFFGCARMTAEGPRIFIHRIEPDPLAFACHLRAHSRAVHALSGAPSHKPSVAETAMGSEP